MFLLNNPRSIHILIRLSRTHYICQAFLSRTGAGREHQGSLHLPHAAKPPLEQIFRYPISRILDLESVRPPLLRSLYAFLSNFSPRTSAALSYREEIHKLSSISFRSPEARFEKYLISVRNISHCTYPEKDALPLDFCDRVEELALLLRCCLTLLTWPGFDQNLILEKGEFLLDVLRRSISFNVSREKGKQLSISKQFRRKRTYDEDGYTSSVVEVYADELLAAESLRTSFVCVESAVSQNPLLKFDVSGSEIELVLEVLCAHLISLASDEQAVENGLDRLNRQHRKEFRVPELEAIGADMSRQHMGLHIGETDCYLIAFEKSLHRCPRRVGRSCGVCWPQRETGREL